MPQLYRLNRPDDDASAVCLDGSPGGFYFAPGRNGNINSWHIHLEGGGWCYTPAQCFRRSRREPLGSSKDWPQQATFHGFGPLSSDPTVNPAFRAFNQVYVKYCDGGSFAGDTEITYESASAEKTTLHFRGRRILLAVVRRLISEFGLGSDSGAEVLLSGCSAGGLAVLFNADRVRAALPDTVVRYKAVCGSGFFPARPSVDGVQVYQSQMKEVFFMQHLSQTLPSRCLSSQHAGQDWRCVIAANVSPFVESPVFFLDSIADRWQLGCIFNAQPIDDDTAEIPAVSGCFRERQNWSACLGKDFQHVNISSRCTPSQVGQVKAFGDDQLQDILSFGVEASPGNGAFVTSCVGHCGFLQEDWHEVRLFPVGGTPATKTGVLMRDAVYRWWLSDASESGANSHRHVYLPCALNSEPPFQCNPTCPPPLVTGEVDTDRDGGDQRVIAISFLLACVCFSGLCVVIALRGGARRKYAPAATSPDTMASEGTFDAATMKH